MIFPDIVCNKSRTSLDVWLLSFVPLTDGLEPPF